MEFSFQLNADEYASAVLLGTWKMSILTQVWLYFLPTLGILFLADTLRLGLVTGDWSGAPVEVGTSFVLLGICFYSYSFAVRRRFRKTPIHHERRDVTADDCDLQIKMASSESRTKWNFFSKYAENKKVFILFQQGNRVFIPISKREMTSEQISELRSLFDTHLKRA